MPSRSTAHQPEGRGEPAPLEKATQHLLTSRADAYWACAGSENLLGALPGLVTVGVRPGEDTALRGAEACLVWRLCSPLMFKLL